MNQTTTSITFTHKSLKIASHKQGASPQAYAQTILPSRTLNNEPHKSLKMAWGVLHVASQDAYNEGGKGLFL